jgi:hypothetical protein
MRLQLQYARYGPRIRDGFCPKIRVAADEALDLGEIDLELRSLLIVRVSEAF